MTEDGAISAKPMEPSMTASNGFIIYSQISKDADDKKSQILLAKNTTEALQRIYRGCV